jgi:hypothetical protein
MASGGNPAILSPLSPLAIPLLLKPRLPVMTKAEMMGSFDAVATDLRLTLDAVERHLAHSPLIVHRQTGIAGRRPRSVYPACPREAHLAPG